MKIVDHLIFSWFSSTELGQSVERYRVKPISARIPVYPTEQNYGLQKAPWDFHYLSSFLVSLTLLGTLRIPASDRTFPVTGLYADCLQSLVPTDMFKKLDCPRWDKSSFFPSFPSVGGRRL